MGKTLRQDLFAPLPRQRLALGRGVRPQAVWMGVGLCNETLAEAMPVDVLVMVLAQEAVRRALELPRSLVLVADSNALASGFDAAEVERLTLAREHLFGQLAAALDLPLQCVRGSAVAPLLRTTWDAHANPYEAHQLAQMDAMADRGATVKIGWVMSQGVRDESFFDATFDRVRPGRMSFVYTVCGRALDHRRPRACPYVAVHPERRILLQAGEDISAKLARADDEAHREVKGYLRLLRKVGRGLAELRGERAPRRAETLVQDLLDRLDPPPQTGLGSDDDEARAGQRKGSAVA